MRDKPLPPRKQVSFTRPYLATGDAVQERITDIRKKLDERRRIADKILAKPLRKR